MSIARSLSGSCLALVCGERQSNSSLVARRLRQLVVVGLRAKGSLSRWNRIEAKIQLLDNHVVRKSLALPGKRAKETMVSNSLSA